MTWRELQDIIESEDPTKFGKLLDAMDIFHDVARFVRSSHDHFLPAAKAWEDYIRGKPTADNWLTLRARLAAETRWHYKRQREHVEKVVEMVIPFPISTTPVDHLWHLFQMRESLWLRQSRHRYDKRVR
jgi:hypothetical protein